MYAEKEKVLDGNRAAFSEAQCLDTLPSVLHPVSVTRFPSFRTQTLENLSHYL